MGSEMCIRDRPLSVSTGAAKELETALQAEVAHYRGESIADNTIAQAGTLAPVGFLPQVMKIRVWAGMCSRVTHHLCHM